MADRYLFTRSYPYDEDAAASTDGTSVGTNTPAKTIDLDKLTFWETADALPQLKIDLGAARNIDSLKFHGDNVSKFRLYHSSDNVIFNATFAETVGATDGHNLVVSFSAQNVRYWRLDITEEISVPTNTKIYEVLLMERKVKLADGQSISSRFTPSFVDQGGGMYRLADGHAKTFSGMTGTKRKYDIDIVAADSSLFSDIETLIENAGAARPMIVASMEPDDLSRVLPMVIVNTPIEFPFTSQYEGTGKNLSFRIEEA